MSESQPQHSDVVERFLRYVQVDTQGDPANADVTPSTACQQDLVELLAAELRELGAVDVVTTPNAYVTAHVPATPGLEHLPTLALNAHVDAEASVPGNGVKPQIVDYQGGKLVMGVVDGKEIYTDPSINPELNDMVGRQIICTDGRTLLAADDKAGVAEIMALVARLLADPSIPHPRLAISFVPDEEIGHGAALLDLEEHGATWGYTLDGGPIGVMNYECFNAAQAKVHFAGFSVHPGTSKDRMVNAIEIACEYENLLPPQAKPQYTDGYDGFIHLHGLNGAVESADAWYILRDHDRAKLEAKKEVMRSAAAYLNGRYGREIVTVQITDEYRNMAEVITEHPHLIENARKAYAANGYTMWTEPMRGGTDGAQLCFRGLPCANISAGYHNAHGVKEFVAVYELEDMVDVLQTLVGLYAVEQPEA
jgi:tripeptide aminopeptidase